MKFIVTVFFQFCVFSIASGAAPQGCTEIANAYFDLRGQHPINVSAVFSIDEDPSYLVVSNISVTYNSNFSKTFCVVPDIGPFVCTSDFAKSLKFKPRNETGTSLFNIQISVNNTQNPADPFSYQYNLFAVLFDEGTFSLDTGEIYSYNSECYGANYYDPRHGKLQASISQCCRGAEIVSNPLPTNTSSCRSFTSRTTIYNTDDNYSIFATTQVNYTIIDTFAGQNLTFYGESQTPDDLKIWLTFNHYDASCWVTQNASKTCYFKLPQHDSKFLINAKYENETIPWDYSQILQVPTVPVGRLIFRNNVAMMDEAMPFSPQNNCQFFNVQFSKNQVASSSFCCTEF